MRTLEATLFSFVYPLFRVDGDEGVMRALTIGGAIASVVIIIWNFLGPVKYGKTAESTKDKKRSRKQSILEYPISSKFTWRYGFIPTVIVPWLVLLFTPAQKFWSFPNLVGMGIYYSHYFNRSILYSGKISEKAAPSPLWFLLSVFPITAIHTFGQSHFLMNVFDDRDPSSGFRTLLGLSISVLGAVTNTYHDSYLTSLKGEGKGYQIPRGGLFPFVSCANYLGEVMEWVGLAIVTNFSGLQTVFAVFSTVFLGFRAVYTHKYYKEKFSNYPKERKALIPFIF